MSKRKVETIIKYLEEVNKNGKKVADAVLENARRQLKKYDELYQKDPFADTKELKAWAAAAIHASMMNNFTQNKLSAQKLADLFSVQKHLVSNRSVSFRKTLTSEKSFGFSINKISDNSETEDLMSALFDQLTGKNDATLDTEPLRFVTKNIKTQLTVDGIGDFEAFCNNFDWTEEQRQQVLELFDKGFADYFDYIYDDSFSINPLPVEERIASPDAVGFAWLALVRSDISDSIKYDVARYMLALALEVKNDPEFSQPSGVLIAVGKLAEANMLVEKQFERALQLVLSEHYVAQDMNRDDFGVIIQSIIQSDNFSVQKRAFFLGKLVGRTSSNSNPHLPVKVVKDILAAIDNKDLREKFLRIMLVPEDTPGVIYIVRSVRKLAGKEIIKNANDPENIIQWLLERAGQGRYNNHAWAALAAALKSAGDTVGDELLRECYNKARCQANARSRRPFYQLAYRRFGEEIVKEAKKDNAASIRRWFR